jgi:hypothetical protein
VTPTKTKPRTPRQASRQAHGEAKPAQTGNSTVSAENGRQQRAQEPPVEREALEDWLARHPAYGAVTLPAIAHDGAERVGEHVAGITANRWTGYYKPDLDKLSPSRLAELKADAVGQYLGKHYQVEELLAAYELSFGGIPLLRHWEAEQVDALGPSVKPEHEEALRLLLGLVWMCSLPRARDAETERAVSTVLNANDAFRAARKLRSKGGKAPRTTSQGDNTRRRLKEYLDENPTLPKSARARAFAISEAKHGRPISPEMVRRYLHKIDSQRKAEPELS